MAKRSIIRSQPDESTISNPAQPRARRSPMTQTADLDAQTGGVNGPPVELAREMRMSGNAVQSLSTARQPSEDDIRLRAYHRYLERGGEHGRAFDDWVEAEQELKLRD